MDATKILEEMDQFKELWNQVNIHLCWPNTTMEILNPWDSYSGFVHSLEFLKKSWNFPSNFPELEKVWKMEIKSLKNGKKSWVFFLFFQSYNKDFRSYIISFWSNLFNLARLFATHHENSFAPALSIEHLFGNLVSKNRNFCFGIKSGKSLEFWIPKSVRTLVIPNFLETKIFFFQIYWLRTLMQ